MSITSFRIKTARSKADHAERAVLTFTFKDQLLWWATNCHYLYTLPTLGIYPNFTSHWEVAFFNLKQQALHWFRSMQSHCLYLMQLAKALASSVGKEQNDLH